MSQATNLFKKLSFRNATGVRVPHKKQTKSFETIEMPIPKNVRILVNQLGAPGVLLVKKGDEVKVGQKIAESERAVSAPIHASVSGRVLNVERCLLPDGQVTDAIVIEADGLQTIDSTVKKPDVASLEDFLRAVKESGLIGLGGAGFPTHIKLTPPPADKSPLETLIINAAECEPYITSDIREILERPHDVLKGISLICKRLKLKRGIIGIEDNNQEGIELLSRLIKEDPKLEELVRIQVLPTKYPQGAEKVMIKACIGRQVPAGKLPLDIGVIVMNVSTIGALARYFDHGMPLVSRRITVAGSGIKEAKNVMAPVGSAISDIVNFCGGYVGEPRKILLGGPMMGVSVATDEYPVSKGTNGILVFKEQEVNQREETECIRCARCVNACPMKLMPVYLEAKVQLKEMDQFKQLNGNSCIACGCCNFVCPANRKLVQSIKLGKLGR